MPIDYSRYPPAWKSEIVPRILKRANNCCERCGVANKSELYSTTMKIQDSDGRYKQKAVWFAILGDLIRLKGVEAEECMTYFVKKIKVVLTIAHLDHDETNHEVTDDRLQAMCQYCHLNYDAKEKYRRRQVLND